MTIGKITAFLAAPIKPPVIGAIFILIGLYSLHFNVNNAKFRNHRRSEKAAYFGGWFYVIGGIAIVIARFF